MTSIAELGIRVDSGDAVTAATDLDKLTDAGKKTEESSKKAGDAWGRSLSKISTNTQQTVRELQLLNSKQDETARVLITVGQSIQQSAVAFASAASAMAAMRAQAEQANAAQAVTAQTADKTAAAIVKEAGALGEVATKVAPAVDALNKIDQANRKIIEGAGRAPALIDTPVVNAGAQALGKTRVELEKTGATLEKTGISAKQTAAALRGVPAQFTDIFVSLQGGQAPLTVLLQQGGQLKDMFGGIGPAARALGGYVAGLITPFTATAAAVAAVGVAYYKGGEEAQKYQKALILTGNAAGSSADSLAGLAAQVSATVGTTGAAAEVLAQLAGSGKIAGESLGLVATAALQMRDATGRAVEETIAEFIKIAKDPVEAAKILAEQYGAVTAGVYAQITALKEQGDAVGAARLLTESYADTINSRTKEITQNLSLIERGWKAVWGWTKQAGDAALSFGRNASLSEQLASAESDLAKAEKIMQNPIAAMGASNKRSYEVAKSTVQALKDQIQTQENINRAQGNQAKQQRDAVLAMERVDALTKSSLSNEQKRNKELADYQKDLAKIRAANPNDARLAQDVIDKNIQNIKDKNKDPKQAGAGAVDLTGYNDAQNNLKSIVSAYQNTQKELDAAQKAGLVSQEVYILKRQALIGNESEEITEAYEAEISALEAARGRASTTAAQRIQLDQKIADARTAMVVAQKKAETEQSVLAKEEEGRLEKQKAAVTAYTNALKEQNLALQRAGDRAAAGVGMGDRQASLSGSLNGIEENANRQRLDLARDKADASRNMSAEEYQKKLEAINQSERDLTETTLANYDKMSAAQGEWRNGATSAFQNYLESARDVAGQTRSLFTNAFSGMEDSIVEFAVTGKASFSDLAKSILSDMARIAVRQASSSALSSLFGMAAGAASSYFGGASSAGLGASQAGYSSSFFPQAKGGAWSGGAQMFANGGAFTNSIVSQPTAFGMSGGKTGVMGEAGPEAIVPLARTSSGALGIRQVGGSNETGGNTYNFPVAVSIQTDGGEGGATVQDASSMGRSLQSIAKAEAEQAISRSLKPGGQMWSVMNGR